MYYDEYFENSDDSMYGIKCSLDIAITGLIWLWYLGSKAILWEDKILVFVIFLICKIWNFEFFFNILNFWQIF